MTKPTGLPRKRGVTLPVLYDDPNEDHSWEKLGLCRGRNPRMWFPTIRDDRYEGGRRAHETPLRTAAARRICGVCPVQEECLSAALRRREPIGVWGGLNTKERVDLLRRRHVA